jgi:hypothetical protein
MGPYLLGLWGDRQPTVEDILIACREGLVGQDEARAELERLRDEGVFRTMTAMTRELLARLTRIAALRPYVAADNPWKNMPAAARAACYPEDPGWGDDDDVA